MKALVIGGDSSLGQALCTELLRRGHEVVRTTRRDSTEAPVGRNEHVVYLDMLVPRLPGPAEHMDVVYIMAAVTGVVPAERHPDAWRINADAPVALAQRASDRSWHVVFPSSGTVELAPHTASARQKSYAETFVLLLGGCVVRLLPRVAPEKFGEVAGLLADVGEQRCTGLVRWEG